jgi:hypothetical protein
MPDAPRVTVWNEYRHERSDEEVAKVYPDGIHGALAAALRYGGLESGLPPSMSASMAFPRRSSMRSASSRWASRLSTSRRQYRI